MKKQIKKLNLNKSTISNLGTTEMTKIIGGNATKGNNCTQNTCNYTCSGGTCGGPPFTKKCNSF